LSRTPGARFERSQGSGIWESPHRWWSFTKQVITGLGAHLLAFPGPVARVSQDGPTKRFGRGGGAVGGLRMTA
jgi:hypothetical protein